MRRLWMNHWFSTAYNIINLIRDGVPDIKIIGSNEHGCSPIMKVCDEWYQEPALKDDKYVDFCLDFCHKYNIDLFMPRREILSISKNKDQFTKVGIKVMVDDYRYVSMLNRKDKTYDYFKQHGIGVVPDYSIAVNIDQFKEAYEKLSKKYKRICFKFVRDEGGKSYRLIDNSSKGYAALFKKQSTRMSFDDAVDALAEKSIFPPVMLMPFLPDEEISVDCLSTSSGLIAIPRVKDATRIERVSYNTDILKTCEEIYKQIPLAAPCNIQFKYMDGIPYILEVNTRMSGGIQMGCEVSGVNIPAIAVNKLMGISVPWVNNQAEKNVTHVEIPIVLE